MWKLLTLLGLALTLVNGQRLKNAGRNCWNPCHGRQGPCAWCGTGLCCRKRWHDTSKGCNGAIGGSNFHACVSAVKLLYPGDNCWEGCNHRQGPCASCGKGLCCRKGWHDRSNGCNGSIGGGGYHACVSAATLLNPGANCWKGCNGKQGPCAWCGTGLCCRIGWHDRRNGCNGYIGGAGYHACVSAAAVTLLNPGANCWEGCNRRQGPCAWCGIGYCCRKGWHGNGCNGSIGGGGYHACVSRPYFRKRRLISKMGYIGAGDMKI